MADETEYAIHLTPMFEPLELVDVRRLMDEEHEPWWNQSLCRVNDSVVRLGVLLGEFHWHKHDDGDEFFLVLDGRMRLQVEGDVEVELGPLQGYTVPRGVLHRPVSSVRTAVLMVENATVRPTGD